MIHLLFRAHICMYVCVYVIQIQLHMCVCNLDATLNFKKLYIWGWRDGSVVKSSDYSSRGPEFNSQQPHGGSQPSVMGSNALFWSVSNRMLIYIKLIHLFKKIKKESQCFEYVYDFVLYCNHRDPP